MIAAHVVSRRGFVTVWRFRRKGLPPVGLEAVTLVVPEMGPVLLSGIVHGDDNGAVGGNS
jgi:hypothetical protein